jgi:hypothetical protein
MFLPVIPSQPSRLTVTVGVFSNTVMPPVEYSRKIRQRASPRKKGAGMFLPVIPVFVAPNSDNDMQLAKTTMSPVEHSWMHYQRTDPRKKGEGIFLPVHLVFPRLIKVTAGVFSNTLMSPGNIRRNIVSGLVRKRRVRECSYRCTWL